MMFENHGGNAFRQQHADVLECPIPDDENGVKALVDECKRRGNAAYKGGSLLLADILYTRAIDLDETNEALLTNRSMTRLGMGKMSEALDDAEKSITINNKWEKGYFRKALAEAALGKLNDAKSTLSELIKINPANKAAHTELSEIEARLAKSEKVGLKEDTGKEETTTATPKKIETKAKRIVSTTESQGDKVNSKNRAKKADSDDKDYSMRGYRVLPDGRKTTYFNRELSEFDKKLMEKDAAPKRLTETTEVAAKEAVTLEKGASAWNQSGTFEEKGMTEWAREKLKELTRGIEVDVEAVSGRSDATIVEDLVVSGLAELEGDASIAFTRAKRRHIFDFSFLVNWETKVSGKTISGSLFFPDVSGDSVLDNDLDYELRWSDRERAGLHRKSIQAAVENKEKGLVGLVSKAVKTFAKEFKSL